MKVELKTLARVAAVFLAITSLALSATAASVSAALQPTEVSVGESAQLRVTVTGARAEAPSIPKVAGLDIRHVAESTQIQVINGAMNASATHSYLVTPQRAGTFNIPAIESAGAKSEPITLRAVHGGGSATAQQRATRSALPPPATAAPLPGAKPAHGAQYGFLQFALPKREFYVGELVPVEVSAYIPDGLRASVTGLPSLSSEAFTIHPLGDKPARGEEVIDGRSYAVLTWHSAVTAVKAGDYSLSMQMPVTVVVRERQQPRSRGRSGSVFDMFDDFFDDPFFARGTEKQITLASEAGATKVLPLPVEDRPADFRGAVGQFEIAATAEPTKTVAGDPITLRMKVIGKGNFDRVTSDMLPPAGEWKTYPPKSSFEPADSVGYQGTKTLEQLVVPNDGNVTAVPELSFSFFDPHARQYETRTTAPIPLEVTPAPAGAKPPLVASPEVPGVAQPANELLPNKLHPGHFTSTLTPLFMRPWFLAAQTVPVLALAGGLLFLRRKHRLATDPQFARASAAERAIRAELDAMDTAMRHGEAARFFSSARGALQQRLGERWKLRPEAITLAEVDARLNGEGAGVRSVFQMADAVSYSDEQLGAADFREWKARVLTELQNLEQK